jgi:hypothetical protein
MNLYPSQPTYNRGEKQATAILEETALGIAASELAAETFSKGVILSCDLVEERANKYRKPANNRIYQTFMGLKACGYDGVYGENIFSPDELFHAFAFLHSTEWSMQIFGYASPNVCSAVFQAAYARCKIDQYSTPPDTFLNGAGGQVIEYEEFLPGGPVEGLIFYELSLLARMNENAVRNAIQADNSIRKVKSPDSKYIEVPISDARRWLEGTRGFTRSRLGAPKGDSDDLLFVPIARDGSFFNNGCRRPTGFYVGQKGDESCYETFEKALTALNAMEVCYWRRPNQLSGVHGIVRGVDIVAKTRVELGLED